MAKIAHILILLNLWKLLVALRSSRWKRSSESSGPRWLKRSPDVTLLVLFAQAFPNACGVGHIRSLSSAGMMSFWATFSNKWTSNCPDSFTACLTSCRLLL